jgi:hypothetical protein
VFAYFVTPAATTTQAVESFSVAPAEPPPVLVTQADTVQVQVDPATPAVDAVRPQGGPPGTNVTVHGRSLANVTQVLFNGHAATFTVTVDGTVLETRVPEGATTGPLVLITPTPPQVIFGNVMSHWILLTIALFTALAFAPAGLAAIADEAKEGAQGTTMSAYSLTLSLGFIIGPPILGLISERYGGPGMVIFFAALAAALLALVLTRFIQVQVTRSREHIPRSRIGPP